MRIAVDADSLTRLEARGTQRVTLGVYGALALVRPNWEFLFFHQVDPPAPLLAGLPNIRFVRTDIRGDRWRATLNLWQQVRLPLSAAQHGANVMHCPFGTAPRFSRVPKVPTIHDLTPMDFTPDRPDVVRWFRNIRRSARSAAAIITSSEYSKQQLVDRLGADASRIHIAWWAPADHFSQRPPPDAIEEARRSAGLPADRPYLLNFGSVNPHKNSDRLLEAWARQPAALRDRHLLVLSGVEPKGIEILSARVRELGLESSTRILGFMPEKSLPGLVAGAMVMLYPSLSEGFGLPIVDAFKVGTPVLTSNVTSIPEVAGDAAVLVDPRSVEAIASAITALLNDEPRRRALAAAGTERARLFSWERCAEDHARIFEAVAR